MTYIRNTAPVENFSDCDFLSRYFKTGSGRSWGSRSTRKQIIILLLVVFWMELTVLKIGFGKSLIFHSFVRARKMASNYYATAMVITPLNSITEELQI